METRREPLTAVLCLLLWTGVAQAAPDPVGAGRALLATPFEVGGNLIGGAGLVGAALVATGGDAISLLDDNRVTSPLLRGIVSKSVQTLAFALAWTTTRSLELLRREDIERLPEPLSAYVGTARTAGRLDTALSGFSALGLALRDAWSGPALALTRAVGATGAASALESGRREARIRALGPDPLPPAP